MFFSRHKKPDAIFSEQALEHLDALYGTALRLTHNEADAEDLVQDTYVRALRFSHRFEPGTNLKAWLFRMMVNLFINKVRRHKRSRQIHEGTEKQDVMERVMSDERCLASQRPEEFFFERLLSDDVVQAVDGLVPDFKLVVLLADVNGFSYAQIAEILGIPVGTVMSRLHRGRRSLRKSLYNYAVVEGYLKPEGNIEQEVPADLGAFRRKKLSGEGR